jgi:tetratricopeptide (TPR) repeat protein
VTLPISSENSSKAVAVAAASPPGSAPTATQASTPRGNPDFPDRPWIRWNDYGIGLLLQGDLKGASTAFQKVAELAKDKPDGPLNLARCKLQEGDLPAAKAALAESEKRRPGWGKTQVFRALVSKEEGRLDDALADFDRVLARFPKDRFVLNQKARVLYLAGRYAEALPPIDKVLASDGEDLGAHYNAMLCLKALGRTEEAAAEEKWYRFFKDDESARALLADYRIAHPYDNRESLPIHVHDDPQPARAVPPPWMAEIGPKGYEYKAYAPKGEMVLKDDRPAGAPRPFARTAPPPKQAGGKTPSVPVALALPFVASH